MEAEGPVGQRVRGWATLEAYLDFEIINFVRFSLVSTRITDLGTGRKCANARRMGFGLVSSGFDEGETAQVCEGLLSVKSDF